MWTRYKVRCVLKGLFVSGDCTVVNTRHAVRGGWETANIQCILTIWFCCCPRSTVRKQNKGEYSSVQGLLLSSALTNRLALKIRLRLGSAIGVPTSYERVRRPLTSFKAHHVSRGYTYTQAGPASPRGLRPSSVHENWPGLLGHWQALFDHWAMHGLSRI